MILSGGYPYSGEALGILMFDNRRYPMAPGTHTLQLLLADYAHTPHNPPVMSEQITIVVK